MKIKPSTLCEVARSNQHSNEIFIVDDSDGIRGILTAVLSLEGYPVISFPDGETFLKSTDAVNPICVFLDVLMPGRSGIDILKELTARHYAAPIFVISALDDTATVVDALKCGAHDFLRKPIDPYAAVQLVRVALDLWTSRETKTDAPQLANRQFPGRVHLTRREAEVLAQIVRGASSKDTGEMLGIGKRTVDNFRMSIMKKLGARNTADLVRITLS